MQQFLLDANVLIPVEPTSPADIETDTPLAVDVVQRATALGFRLLVHPATIRELATDQDVARRVTRQVLLAKYQELADPPDVQDVVFERHTALVAMLEDFGFERNPGETPLGELAMVKRLTPAAGAARDHFDYHSRFGPPAVDISRGDGVYVIPIQPRYHARLFPDHPREQARLLPDDDPFGNALRKAYLSRSPVAPLPRGATLLFYRSDDWRAIAAVGVVEHSMRSDDPATVAALAGQRTVYSYAEIESMVQPTALAILFRQDRLLDPLWPFGDLQAAGVLNAPPQSITQVQSEDGVAWLTSRLAASS